MSRHRLALRTHDGQLLTVLDNVISWTLVRKANEIGQWNVIIDPNFDRRFLQADNLIEFWRKPEGGAETLLGVGFMRSWEWATDDEGHETLTIAGPDVLELLARRIVQNYAETSYTNKSGPADDLIKEIVYEQYLSTAARLGDLYYSRSSALPATIFSIAPDMSLGETVGCECAWRDIFPVLQELAVGSWNAGTMIYFDLEYVGPGQFMLQTWAGLRGVDRSIGSGVVPVIFSQEAGNLAHPVLRFDYSDEVNFAYGGGQGQGTARETDPENDEPRSQLSLWNRREAFADARECPAGESPTYCIATKAYNRMQDGRPKVIFEGDLLDTQTTRFGIDWGYGDKVTIRHRGMEFDGRVDMFTVTISPDGAETVTARVSILETIEGHPD